MNLQEKFNKYTELVKIVPNKPKDEDLLALYGLYKIATVGKCATKKPKGVFNHKEQCKWDAWNARNELTAEQAMDLYIKQVDILMN